jgi:hydrogenase nickel incorporation protein HypA/HybF
MHEMSLCKDVLHILDQLAQAQRFTRVRTVYLEIGVFACVEPDAMRFGFEAVAQGTLAEGARLEVIQVPGKALCMACNQLVPVRARFDTCSSCGGDLLSPNGGNQLSIKELEVE